MVPEGGRPAADGDRSPNRTSQNREVSGRLIVSAKLLYRTPDPITFVTTISCAQTLSAALGRTIAALLTVSSTNCGTRPGRQQGPLGPVLTAHQHGRRRDSPCCRAGGGSPA